ncbi:MAG: cupredoxin domain-containing protein [Myxococcota bacterium]
MRTLLILTITLAFAGCKKDAPPPPVETAKPAPKPAETPKVEAAAKPEGGARTIALEVTNDGFVPSNITLKANEPVKFVVTRKTDETCATDLLIDGTDIKVALPLDKAVEVAWTPTKAGKVRFGCAMDMMIGGVLLVE